MGKGGANGRTEGEGKGRGVGEWAERVKRVELGGGACVGGGKGKVGGRKGRGWNGGEVRG